MDTNEKQGRIDPITRFAWIIFGVMCAVFLLGLVITSFWGGPFESTSFWQQDAPPTYPN
jgi:uncharacterized membrane protein